MRAVQRPDDTMPCDLAPGEWSWVRVDFSSKGGPANLRTIAYHTPNPHEGSIGILDHRWTITGDGDAITVSPSIHNNPGKGTEHGEWHGHLQAGAWAGC